MPTSPSRLGRLPLSAGSASTDGCRVVLAAERADLRSGLRAFLEQESEVYVVAEVATSDALLTTARWLGPDVILVHSAMLGDTDGC